MKEHELMLDKYMASDHAKQVSAMYYVEKLLTASDNIVVLDLGCGRGETADMFSKINPTIKWLGIDIADSPEVRERIKQKNIITFNGINIPLKNEAVDIIYCNQVLEHVERPYELINEVVRTLKPGGHFIGSVSQLEPYHSYSIFNFTYYGICKVLV